VLENVRALEALGARKLGELAARHPQIGEVRAVGAFQAIELVRDRATKERDRELQDATWAEAVRRGVFTDSSSTSLNIQPSLTMDPERFGEALDTIGEALAAAIGELGR
jgi:4-aminobutyrate aminotransferase-like enzyme